uniref:non-specific serine/threonine protein kinase n=1 Tax=Oncorhynchus kisutch TaxID=8019 RepID=A0A8C7IND2_ONCKI
MEEDIPPLLEPDTLTPACPNLSRRRMYRLCSTEHIPPLPDTQLKPAPTSQDPEPHCWPGPSPSLGPRGMEGADFMEPISPKPNTQTENSITDPDTLVLIHPPQGPVAPHRPCPSHKRIHGVGIGISVGPMEPIPPHSNTQASVTDPDTLNLIQETRQITHKNDTVEDNVTDCHCDTHVLMLVTQDPVTGLLNHHHHHHHVRTEKEDMAQSEGLEPGYHDATPPPVDAYWVLCDSITSVTHDGTEGASLKRSEENNDSPNELWLDACQYQTLAAEDGEGEEGAILGGDEWGLYPIRGSGVTECPDNTKESGSLLGTEAAIGQGGCDSDQGLSVPPFDRSVSTDSWYSTFSDWAVIVPGGGPRPEDFTGTAALTQKQGQAQAYPQTPMAIQHQAVEPRASPESPILAGPEELLVVGSLQDREGEGEDTQTEESHSGCISSAGQGDQEPVGELWGNPPFLMPVMPLAPLGLSVGRSLFCRTNSALEGDTVQASPKRSLLNEQRGQSCGFIQSNVPRLPVLPACFRGKIDKKTPVVNKEEKLLLTKTKRNTGSRDTTSEDKDKLTICSGQNLNRDIPASSSSSEESTASWSLDRKKTITVPHEVSSLGKELSSYIIVTGDHLMISEKERVAYFTLDQENPLDSRTNKEPNHCVTADVKKGSKMPHKTRTHSKKDKPAVVHHLAPPTSKTQENLPLESNIKCDPLTTREDGDDGPVTVKETIVITENVNTKGHAHGKKKKHSGKHSQNASVKSEGIDSLVEVENRAKQKTATNGKIDTFVAKFGAKAGKTKDKTIAALPCKDSVHSDSAQKQPGVKSLVDASVISQGATVSDPSSKVPQSTIPIGQQPNDDVIKRRRLSEDKFGKHEPKAAVETTRRKAYSDVLKQRTHHAPKEVPRVVQRIQAVPVSGDPQSLSLGCQFTAVFTDYTVTWTRDGTVLAEIKRSAGDESRVCLTITKASNKDLGKYRCSLLCSHGSVILDYLLTYEGKTPAPTELVGEEEDVKCSCLLFKEDFLSEQYFDKNQPASLVTEKEHFGEGMHRRAFRTRLKAGMVPVFTQGHHCVLKVHNAISYGTQNNEELVQKNYNLAVEECHVQNTAREYIKVWTAVAQTQDAFGEVPEIIPIYLVHRPSNDIPYATLEEELMGEFVKYSVRDGKEINLKRNDSEAGQKCCTFQHWVYHKTEGNLLVTDMQGVGMRLTDVGIATCKKGYKGFKGNCATSFIDQFKALHLCNKYCEILGLKSLQPKPKKTVVPKPKPTQPVTKTKKTIGPTLKSKS